ncbi:hypothetical protein IRP63_14170 (plasmid) [Clostridium botulinum]|uniref:hypothetical protein n=1 Tax=Clostridium botulinum TaxID=1491 RepID=UPI000A9DE506|nr:hypothetical protein [Clostridium botulinum]MCD3232568.1 hypothetical protein [Clostridium botulinum D/C]MCD3238503.1 hypothetical protein [Clostridium botulinum D/C]MCD3265977.1 hypothetical protein [Clostridium botulinum D/C]MCD3300267.1 hypothetical protein [Clostridium botulinum D/C]MCD3304216.1 hypothetical protein [Clostridium botulinum D/C]
MEEYNLCDDCEYGNRNTNDKPCTTCLNWVDGYLEPTNYEPKGLHALKNNS